MEGIVLSRLRGSTRPPQRLGRFVVLDRLGEGGMGVVYAAYDEQLDRKVAVKVLHAWRSGQDADGCRRLVREARAMARLSHPNIVTVHEVGTHGEDVFVAMEHVRGQSLDRWLGESGSGGRSWRGIVEVFAAAGRGLAAAHRRGIVHRDFKPHNVIVDDEGAVKVLDFGLARVLASPAPSDPVSTGSSVAGDTSPLTETGAVMGTPAYMAPEQRRGLPADARSDQFSFFASLHHALYQQLPFPTDSARALADACEQGRVRAPPPDAAVPRWLHRALLVGLRPDPAARYPSMEAALTAITRDPGARRGRLALYGLVAGLVSSSTAYALTRPAPEPPAPCDLGARTMAAHWDDEAHDRALRGLEESGSAAAAASWPRVAARLDTYAERWSAARDDACLEHRNGATSATLYDLQVACFDRSHHAFTTLVELLAQSSGEPAPHALAAAAELPSIDACGDVSALLAAAPPPDDPARAEEVEHLRRRLSRVTRLASLGRYADASREAEPLAVAAERTGFAPLRTEVALRRGAIEMLSGSPSEADEELTRALALAVASRHLAAAMEAVALRIFVRAELMRAPDHATDDVALGAALVGRHELPPYLRSLYFNSVGAYHLHRFDDRAAHEALLDALSVLREAGTPQHPNTACTRGNLAIVEDRRGHLDASRQQIDAATRMTSEVLGPDHPVAAELAGLRAELLRRAGRLNDAEAEAKASLERLRRSVGPRSPMLHRPLLTLGELALTHGNHDAALEHFQRAAALRLTERGGSSTYAVLQDAGLARARIGRGEIERGLALGERALAACTGPAAPYEAQVRVQLGDALLERGRATAALEHFERAAQLERPGPPGTASAAHRGAAEARRHLEHPPLAEDPHHHRGPAPAQPPEHPGA